LAKLRIDFRVHRLTLALLIAPGLLRAQSPDPLLDRLHRAELATTLTRDGVNPFYLKIDVQLYDAKGKPSEKGTIEEWWAGVDGEDSVHHAVVHGDPGAQGRRDLPQCRRILSAESAGAAAGSGDPSTAFPARDR
jgi:hypothetical protein